MSFFPIGVAAVIWPSAFVVILYKPEETAIPFAVA